MSIFMLALESEQAEDLHVPCQQGEQRQKSSGHHREGGAQQGQGTSPCLPMPCCAHAGGQGQDPSGHLQSNGTEGAAVWALGCTCCGSPVGPWPCLSMASPSLSWSCPLTGERERISVATACGPGIMAAAPFPDLRLFSWGNNSAQKTRSQVGGDPRGCGLGPRISGTRSCRELQAPFCSDTPIHPHAPAHPHAPCQLINTLAHSWVFAWSQ